MSRTNDLIIVLAQTLQWGLFSIMAEHIDFCIINTNVIPSDGYIFIIEIHVE